MEEGQGEAFPAAVQLWTHLPDVDAGKLVGTQSLLPLLSRGGPLPPQGLGE